MNLNLIKDIAETVAYLVASVGGLCAALWAVYQWHVSVKQREVEHRWRQAEVGRQLIGQLFDDDSDAGDALEIVDKQRDDVKMPDGSVTTVTEDDITKALTNTSDSCPTSREIRRRFDALFYHLERFQHMIDIGLITREDVLNPTQYYCRKLTPFNSAIPKYLNDIGYTKAHELITSLQVVEQ